MASKTKTDPRADGRPLWEELLPVLQEINNYGGNFTSAFVCRAVIEEIDRRAKAGDVSLAGRAERMRAALRRGRWPQDPNAFNAFFESYHEAVFHLLATERGIELAAIPEAEHSTADLCRAADIGTACDAVGRD